MINGTVTMSLNEVDALRKQITDKEEQIKLIQDSLKHSIEDKRVVIKHATYNRGDYRVVVPTYKLGNLSERIQKHLSSGGRSEFHYMNLSDRLDLTYEVDIETKSIKDEYKNFDDVKQELREEIEKTILQELVDLRAKVRDSEIKQAEVKEEADKKIKEEVKKYLDLTKIHKEIIEKKDQKYEDLKNDKKRISREEELLAVIEKLKARKWYHFFS